MIAEQAARRIELIELYRTTGYVKTFLVRPDFDPEEMKEIETAMLTFLTIEMHRQRYFQESNSLLSPENIRFAHFWAAVFHLSRGDDSQALSHFRQASISLPANETERL
ncbi:MAG TPA: hypothetical protein VMT55_03860, partial [Candidatus Sulfotelmatobacter sp.]|nr:hypothetical protein [Candidatus Sulfotelmatobacter sp.]